MITAEEALKQYFGYDHFRALQREVIEAVLSGNDTIVLMPTGGGKSICYQVPALVKAGCALVVSPLIALMKDQVEGLRQNGIRAAYLNSSLPAAEQRQVEDQLLDGDLKLLYVSPEKLLGRDFHPLLRSARFNLIAIDEAHCISAWGHDFRPEYTQLGHLRQLLPGTPIIALTATADKLTRQDILKQLQLHNPQQFVASFDRPNLRLDVRPAQQRIQQIVQFLRERPEQPGIIYTLSRKSAESVSEKLRKAGFSAEAYHAGLSSGIRSAVQERFISDHVQIVCATIAFGMGIDKSNVRWVIHYNLPKNIEGYYQEIGRAGRDGDPADALLFYNLGDVFTLREILDKQESNHKAFQLAKLDRMQQLAEALGCRRRILLNYFGEDYDRNCGNCDICLDPPQFMDGTVIAQKALSAVYRLREGVGATLLIDVLRGSSKRTILENGLHHIKTYGAGKDISFRDWQYYIQQLINLGYLEIAYDQNRVLRLTPASRRLLFEGQTVQLVTRQVQEERQQAKQPGKISKKQRAFDDLFEQLRQLRKTLAQQFGVPPYMILTDANLRDMVEKKPTTETQLERVDGMSTRKIQRYGSYFLDAMVEFISRQSNLITGGTHKVSLALYERGLAPEEIARERGIKESTVISHLAAIYQQGEDMDISRLISPEEIARVTQCLPYVADATKLRSIYEYLNGEMPYEKIRLALAHHYRQKQATKS